MTPREWRLARSGRCVKDWELCTRLLEGVYHVVKDRFDMFLGEHPQYKGVCAFSRGDPPKVVPRITLEFQRRHGGVLSDRDTGIILTQMYRLIGWRSNLKFHQLGGSGLFTLIFEIVFGVYSPFADRQLEIDLFSPHGGNASPPDPTRYGAHKKYPWEPPWFPPKDSQPTLDLTPPVSGMGASDQPRHSWKKRRIVTVHWEDEGPPPEILAQQQEAMLRYERGNSSLPPPGRVSLIKDDNTPHISPKAKGSMAARFAKLFLRKLASFFGFLRRLCKTGKL